MIQIQQLKLHIAHSEADLIKKIKNSLHLKEDTLLSYRIKKRSLDARKKPDLYYIYTVLVTVDSHNEAKIVKRAKNKNISSVKEKSYHFPNPGTIPINKRPIIVGCGPAGLFCTYYLAKAGYNPVLIERGAPVEERKIDVDHFWNTGKLNPESNVQFGEGGAGTFSDGKLNTLVKDTFGRNQEVLKTLVKFGAPENILYENKPHIGTDLLMIVISNMRKEMIRLGADIRFHTKFCGYDFTETTNGHILNAIEVENTRTGKKEKLETETLVLALGHSARDTFSMLYENGINMQAKSFAIGVRVEHPQGQINASQYGAEQVDSLPAAAYKLTHQLDNGRGVYTFCMCPGGYVVNASSEENRLAINGMSYHDRAGKNANTAVIVTVTPDDFGSEHPLEGIEFQRKLEALAYQEGNGKIPVQRFEDFKNNVKSTFIGSVEPQMKGQYTLANVRKIFPDEIAQSIEDGIIAFGHKIQQYDHPDTIVSGVESRTSSPIKMIRDENLESNIVGIYPCGEGAGYAGGITSAAMDGIKVAESIAKKYCIIDKH